MSAYPATGVVQPQTGLVLGYDFLTDGAEETAASMTSQGLAVTSIINDSWTAADLRTALLGSRQGRRQRQRALHLQCGDPGLADRGRVPGQRNPHDAA